MELSKRELELQAMRIAKIKRGGSGTNVDQPKSVKKVAKNKAAKNNRKPG